MVIQAFYWSCLRLFSFIQEMKRLCDEKRFVVLFEAPLYTCTHTLKKEKKRKLKAQKFKISFISHCYLVYRDVYEYMVRQKEKGRGRSGKGESVSMQQVQAAHDEYDEEATLFVFRIKSLKQGQSRSLLTQAARHHAAQVYSSNNVFSSYCWFSC